MGTLEQVRSLAKLRDADPSRFPSAYLELKVRQELMGCDAWSLKTEKSRSPTCIVYTYIPPSSGSVAFQVLPAAGERRVTVLTTLRSGIGIHNEGSSAY